MRVEAALPGPGPSRPVLPGAALPRPALALASLLGATFLGTAANNILNVPLRDVCRDLGSDVSSGVLVVSSFVITLAGGLVLSGWIGDRLGRRRVLVAATVLMTLASAGAALAPSLAVLVVARAVQGIACSAFPPVVMSLLSSLYPPGWRGRLLSAWAAANGVGQAIGPPAGGLVAQSLGWRAIFWLVVAVGVVIVVLCRVSIPPEGGRRLVFDPRGAVLLSLGIVVLLTGVTLVAQRVLPLWWAVLPVLAGAAMLVLFARVSAASPAPLVRRSDIVEVRFVRSAIAAAAQMFCLTVTLVSVPLYLTGTLDVSTGRAGLLVLALPAMMAILAPAVGVVGDRAGPRRVLRTGLVLLVAATAAVGLCVRSAATPVAVTIVALAAVGVGVALVQTPSAAGATRSAAGRSGAGLGLFNMIRFAASSLAAAWVALVHPDHSLVLFGGCAVVAAAGLLVSFSGALRPEPEQPHPATTTTADTGPRQPMPSSSDASRVTARTGDAEE